MARSLCGPAVSVERWWWFWPGNMSKMWNYLSADCFPNWLSTQTLVWGLALVQAVVGNWWYSPIKRLFIQQTFSGYLLHARYWFISILTIIIKQGREVCKQSIAKQRDGVNRDKHGMLWPGKEFPGKPRDSWKKDSFEELLPGLNLIGWLEVSQRM